MNPDAPQETAPPVPSTPVAIVEDDPGIRAGWKAILNRMPGYHCSADYPSAEAALAHLPSAPPEIVLMDINLPGMNGIECTRQLLRILPSLDIVMLTMFGDHDNLFEALRAGACGYLLKRTTPEALREALQQAKAGGAPMSPQIARQMVTFFRSVDAVSQTSPASPGIENLSSRETDVLRLLAEGQPYKTIADALDLTIDTIRTYIRRIYKKLQVNSRTEAVVRYLEASGQK
ncbi:MAG: hypothetical protein RLZZ142_601 [Verrucomicrobiota bacterium]|jgi:DNA-binding NarL/FixJ family response regulator